MTDHNAGFQYGLLVLFLIFFAYERMSSTFTKKTMKIKTAFQETFFTSLMLLLYASIVLYGAASYFFSPYPLNGLITTCGFIVLIGGAIIRRWSIKTLSENWSVYTRAENVRNVVDQGPFHYSRHPYYWASVLELFGVSLIWNFNLGIYLTVCIYVPLLVYRCYLEERALMERFPRDYSQYKNTSPFVFNPLAKGCPKNQRDNT